MLKFFHRPKSLNLKPTPYAHPPNPQTIELTPNPPKITHLERPNIPLIPNPTSALLELSLTSPLPLAIIRHKTANSIINNKHKLRYIR